MKDKKRLIKILSCALTLAVACSCGAASEKQTQAPTLPKTESLPSYSENIETTFYSENIETTAPETSTEHLELSEEPDFEFSEAQKMIEDFFLGIWESESNEKFMIGVTEESDCRDFFDGHGLLWDAQLTDTSAVIVCQNFISDRFRIVIDFCDPDVLLFYDNNEEKADGDCAKKYTRVGRASMYPDTGIMNSYLMSMLYHCYGYIELSTEIGSLSTDSVYFNGKNAGKELTVLVSHDNNQIVFASSFVPLTNQNEEEKITYIRYSKIKNEGAWILGDWSYVDYRAIEKKIQELKTDSVIKTDMVEFELDHVIARYTTGFIFETNQIDIYDETFNSISAAMRDKQEEPTVTLRSGETLDEKTVVTYAGTLAINSGNRSLYLTGEFRLSGILRHRKETKMLNELRVKGDLFFYPFPKDISDDPFLLSSSKWVDYPRICDEKNNYYFFADTIELLLGNTETNQINTRLGILFDEARCPEIEYCGEIEEYLNENEYYYAEFVFSNLYLHYYPDRMTGYVFSSGDIQEIVSIEAIQP